MKYRGVIRRVDDLGRIVVPIEFRRILGIKEHDPVEILIGDGEIRIRKPIDPYFITITIPITTALRANDILKDKGCPIKELNDLLEGK